MEQEPTAKNPEDFTPYLGRPKRNFEQVEIENNNPVWTLKLSRYQRDNLLWLFNVIGYPNQIEQIEPFHLAHTGDWTGEIPIMLGTILSDTDLPNVSMEKLKEQVAGWLKQQNKDQ